MHAIGITRCGDTAPYEESVRAAGGRPVILPPGASLEGLDGFILSGGGDVDPVHYGAKRTHSRNVKAERDAFELGLARQAWQRRVPLLCVCRGLQVLNVALGGTLVQDILKERPGARDHSCGHAGEEHDAHSVAVVPGTRLAALMGAPNVDVNSRHHQCVDVLGQGLVVSARSPDGIIEALEPRDHAGWCIGVQWHPEDFHRSGRFRALFEGLVRAC